MLELSSLGMEAQDVGCGLTKRRGPGPQGVRVPAAPGYAVHLSPVPSLGGSELQTRCGSSGAE